MPGWIPITADEWFVQRTQIEGEWPTILVITDLRFWDNPLACSKRTRPTVKALRQTWGWSQGRAYRFITTPEKWRDSGTKKSNDGGTPAENDGTPAENDGTGDVDSTGVIDDDRNGGGTDVERERNDIGTPLIETRARTHTPLLTPTPKALEEVSPQAADDSQPPPKKSREIPEALAEAYARFRKAAGITRTAKLNAYKGQGLKLWRIHEQAKADAVALFDWLATSRHERADFYRSQGMDSTNVARHLDSLLDLMTQNAAPPRRKGPTPDHLVSFADPADVAATHAEQARQWIPSSSEVQTGIRINPDAPWKTFPDRIRPDVRRCVQKADTVACRGSDEWASAYDDELAAGPREPEHTQGQF